MGAEEIMYASMYGQYIIATGVIICGIIVFALVAIFVALCKLTKSDSSPAL